MSIVTSNSQVGKKLLDSLQSDLRTISNEAKKKNPLLKEASEAGIVKLRCACGKQEDLRMALFTESSELMEPFFMACDTKLPKLVQVSLTGIQRMITFESVNSPAASNLINTLWQLMECSIEEIKILQTITLLVSTNNIVSSDSLSKALSICFRLHFTKNPMVNNAASATIRQIVSVIFDRAVREIEKGKGKGDFSVKEKEKGKDDFSVKEKEKGKDDFSVREKEKGRWVDGQGNTGYVNNANHNAEINLDELKLSSKNAPKSLVESVPLSDAFLLFQDLIQLVNADEPYWLNGLTEMTRTFGLELLELIFKHYHSVFESKPEFTFLLKERVAPVIIKLFSANIKYHQNKQPSNMSTNTTTPPGSLTSTQQPLQSLNPSDKPFYPISIRLLRIVTILTQKYHSQLCMEVEIFMNLLIKFLEEDKPRWQRSVALESLHQLTVDPSLIQFFCTQYDMKSESMSVFQEICSSLALFIQSQFLPLGPSTSQGLLSSLIPTTGSNPLSTINPTSSGHPQSGPGFSFRGYSLPLLYTLKNGQTKSHYLEQLDKTEVPLVPDGYTLTLAFHSILEIVRSLVTLIEGSTVLLDTSDLSTGPSSSAPGGAVRTSITPQSKAPVKTQVRVEKTLNIDAGTRSLNQSLLISTWPGLVASLSILLEASTDETVTEVILKNMEVLISLLGIYGLSNPRDAFVMAVGRASLPTGYNLPSLIFTITEPGGQESSFKSSSSPGHFSSLQHLSSLQLLSKNALVLQRSNPSPSLTSGSGGSSETTSELRQQVVAVGTALPPPISSGSQSSCSSPSSAGPVMLTAKNLQIMRGVLMIAHNHGCILKESWIHLLTTLQHLVWILGLKPSQGGSLKATRMSGPESPSLSSGMVSGSMTQSTLITTAAMSDLPVLTAMLSRLFSSSQELDDDGFMHLVEGLLRLSEESLDLAYNNREPSLFAIAKLLESGLVNLFRIDLIWDRLMSHLFDVSSHPHSRMRDWGSETITSLVIAAVSRNDGPVSSHQVDMVNGQSMVIRPLAHSKVKYLIPLQRMSSINHPDIRQKQLDTCLHLLQSTGDSVADGWPVVLTIIGSLNESQSENLIRLAFQCLQLVISDFLSSISIEVMPQVVDVTSKFALQSNELNVSLTAIGSIWNIADYLFQNQDRIKAIIKLYNDGTGNNLTFEHLFLVVFDKLGLLCSDPRPAIRKSASQTLFAALNSHGSTLHPTSWSDIIWTVLFPLLDRVHANITSASDETITDVPKSMGITGIGVTGSILLHHSRNTAHKQWSETQVLSLGGVCKLMRDEHGLLSKYVSDMNQVWQVLLDHIKKAAICPNAEVSLSALNSFLQIVSVDHSLLQTVSVDHSLLQTSTDSRIIQTVSVDAASDSAGSRMIDSTGSRMIDSADSRMIDSTGSRMIDSTGSRMIGNQQVVESRGESSLWTSAWRTWIEIGSIVTGPPPDTMTVITSEELTTIPSQSYLTNLINLFPFIYNHIKEEFTVDDFDHLCTIVEQSLSVPVDMNSQAYFISMITVTNSGHGQSSGDKVTQLSPLQEAIFNILDSLSHDISNGHLTTSGHQTVTSGHQTVTSGHQTVTSGHQMVTSGHRVDGNGGFDHLILPFFHELISLTSYTIQAPSYGNVSSYPLIPKISSSQEWITINFVPFGERSFRLLASLYLSLPTHPIIVQGNILQAIIRSLKRPLSLKYSCPSQSTWKLAINTLLTVLKTALPIARQNESDFVTIWADLALTLEDFLFPSSRSPLNQSLEEQQSDELLDVKVVELIRDDILPFAAQIPQEFILQIVSVLNRGSIHSATADSPIDTESSRKLREDFARSCFETLLQFSFLGPRGAPNLFIQSSSQTQSFDPNLITNNKNVGNKLVTSTVIVPPVPGHGLDPSGLSTSIPTLEVGLVNRLAVTSLLQRFNDVVVKYVQDERLSGKCPLARHRVAEISFVLKALATLIQSLKKAPPESVEEGVWDQLINLYPQLVDCTTSSFVQVNRCLQEVLKEYKDLLRPPKGHEYLTMGTNRSNNTESSNNVVVHSLINGD